VPLSESQEHRLITELEHFHDEFIRYRYLVFVKLDGKLTDDQQRELETVRLQLQRKYGGLKEVILKYGGPSDVPLQGGRVKYEAFRSAFDYTAFHPTALTMVMDTAIATVKRIVMGIMSKPSKALVKGSGPIIMWQAAVVGRLADVGQPTRRIQRTRRMLGQTNCKLGVEG